MTQRVSAERQLFSLTSRDKAGSRLLNPRPLIGVQAWKGLEGPGRSWKVLKGLKVVPSGGEMCPCDLSDSRRCSPRKGLSPQTLNDMKREESCFLSLSVMLDVGVWRDGTNSVLGTAGTLRQSAGTSSASRHSAVVGCCCEGQTG